MIIFLEISRNIQEEERWQVIDACYFGIMYGRQANEDELFNISEFKNRLHKMFELASEHSPDKIFDVP